MANNYKKHWIDGNDYEFSVYVGLRSNTPNNPFMFEWLDKNCPNGWSYRDFRVDDPGQTIYWHWEREYGFKTKKEAMAFKMVWV